MSEPSSKAKQAALELYGTSHGTGQLDRPIAIIQQAIDAATAKLREEFRKLMDAAVQLGEIDQGTADYVCDVLKCSQLARQQPSDWQQKPDSYKTWLDQQTSAPEVEKIVTDAAKKLLHSNADYRWEHIEGILREALAQARAPLVVLLKDLREHCSIWWQERIDAALGSG